MQKMSSVSALDPNFSKTETKFVQDFWLKLKLVEETEEDQEVKLQTQDEEEIENRDGDDKLDLDDDEFSFCRAFEDDSLISAEEAFLNGQIRPISPLFNRDLLLTDDAAFQPVEGPYCEWRGKAVEVCSKSNSTGFSKLRRFRELVLRSNSDGKDKFAFLHRHSHNNPEAASSKGTSEKKTTVSKAKKVETSAFEKIYARRRKEEGSSKRVSYLTYKQVGFFANVNGLSKNVHPY